MHSVGRAWPLEEETAATQVTPTRAEAHLPILDLEEQEVAHSVTPAALPARLGRLQAETVVQVPTTAIISTQQAPAELQGQPSTTEAVSTRITRPRQVKASSEQLMVILTILEEGAEVAVATTATEAVVEEATGEAPI